MKALTIYQPWASLIALGAKTIETRSWSTSYRGPLAIHAAKRPLGNGALNVGVWTNVTGEPIANGGQVMSGGGDRLLDCPLGAVVATCTLVDVLPIYGPPDRYVTADARMLYVIVYGEGVVGIAREPDKRCEWIDDQRPYGDFTPGRFAWLLDDIKPCEPIPAKGRQGLWEWTP